MTASGLLLVALLLAALVTASGIALGFARSFWRLEGEHASKCEALARAECAEARTRVDLAWERARAADLRCDLEVAREQLAEARAEQREPVGLQRIHPTPDERVVH